MKRYRMPVLLSCALVCWALAACDNALIDSDYAYVVTFDSQGGTREASPQLMVVEKPATMIAALPSAPAREGCSFAGWYTEKSGQGTPFTETSPVSDDIRVYAKWNDATGVVVRTDDYSITYNLDGGTNAPANPALYNPGTATITLQAPTRGAWLFGGWFDNASMQGTAVTEIPLGSRGDVVLWAKWTYNDTYKLRVGDIGPAGGRIFYVNGNANRDGWKYMEASWINDQAMHLPWGGGNVALWGADGRAIGTGKQNTAEIIAQVGQGGNYAARWCEALSVNGYDDWFLPSADEMVEVIRALYAKQYNWFTKGYYYTSTECSAEEYLVVWFDNDSTDPGNATLLDMQKSSDNISNLYIRPIRSF
ncbi:MAG TPA: InlB B-repeat-containing protein [Spirochaetales bacterium]|nr:InlB B-repeat-containing protein [Spirochaetales bacterium]HRY53640.1 InlB B-repeat-containing protein [Spirochaetia bacterium]HRZ63729.1 InlB B-repeat-containing protein [Spirochaetia bacterium]